MKEARVSRKSAGKATPPRVSSPESRSLKESFSIGLTIVRKAIQRMGGRVGFESEPGKGSKFWIELPEIKAV